MNDVLRDAIRSAERALRGGEAERSHLVSKMAGLCADDDVLTRPSVGRDLAYLAFLADALGLHSEADGLLDVLSLRVGRSAQALDMNESERNQLAVAFSDRGHLATATRVLAGLRDYGNSSAMTFANQASVKFREGDLAGAAEYAARARRAVGDETVLDGLSVQFLATAILTEAVRADGPASGGRLSRG